MKRIAHLALPALVVTIAIPVSNACAAPLRQEQAAEQPPPVYDESADAAADIAAALAAAKMKNTCVLIQWGANWCGWCKLLHQLFNEDRQIRGKLINEYEVVYVDMGHFDKNLELTEKYGAEINGIPYLTILDGEGNVVTNQETGSLEEGDAHDPAKVLNFLTEHQADYLNAEDLLREALAEAERSNRLVFFHSATPT